MELESYSNYIQQSKKTTIVSIALNWIIGIVLGNKGSI